ncbi:Protein of unknown function [Gryllus bimaculatus]|nr:Protein of unknown function [Gryllus bimaculatus]
MLQGASTDKFKEVVEPVVKACKSEVAGATDVRKCVCGCAQCLQYCVYEKLGGMKDGTVVSKEEALAILKTFVKAFLSNIAYIVLLHRVILVGYRCKNCHLYHFQMVSRHYLALHATIAELLWRFKRQYPSVVVTVGYRRKLVLRTKTEQKLRAQEGTRAESDGIIYNRPHPALGMVFTGGFFSALLLYLCYASVSFVCLFSFFGPVSSELSSLAVFLTSRALHDQSAKLCDPMSWRGMFTTPAWDFTPSLFTP